MTKPAKPSSKSASKPRPAPKSSSAKKALGADELEKVTGGYQTGGSGQTQTGTHGAGGGGGAGKSFRKAGG